MSIISSILIASTAAAVRSDALENDEYKLPSVVNKPLDRPLVYSVEFTSPPCLIPRSKRGEDGAINRLAKSEAVVFGVHQSSPRLYQDILLNVSSFFPIYSSILKSLRTV